MIQRLVLATLAVGAWACTGGDNPVSPTVAGPAVTAAPIARYRVTFDATWSASTHPTEVPRVPHFSGLIGATHRDPQRFWEADAPATEGIRAMAEMGRKTPLDQEVQTAIAAGRAQHLRRHVRVA
jgi:hypothetical protein